MKVILCISVDNQFRCHWHRLTNEFGYNGLWITSIRHPSNGTMDFLPMSPDSVQITFPDEYGSGASKEFEFNLTLLVSWIEQVYQSVAKQIFIFCSSSETTVIYQSIILNPYASPCLEAMRLVAVFTDGNERVHIVHIVNHYVEREALLRMECLTYLPDLNSKENIWYMVERPPSVLRNHPQKLNDLTIVFFENGYGSPPQKMIDDLNIPLYIRSLFKKS
ncbi:hypothetical protein TNCV_3598431 [Trichonephila clavipes]|nr:hypothetical protein TNCV_3598431 [Trichonephila clavipes]